MDNFIHISPLNSSLHVSKDDITPSPPPVPNMLLCILRKLFQLSTARMTSAPLAPSPPSAGCSQGVAQSAGRGREGEGKKIQASRSLFPAVPAFSTGSGKGAGPLFLWRMDESERWWGCSKSRRADAYLWPIFSLCPTCSHNLALFSVEEGDILASKLGKWPQET